MEVSNEHKTSSEKTPNSSPSRTKNNRINGTDVNNDNFKKNYESIESKKARGGYKTTLNAKHPRDQILRFPTGNANFNFRGITSSGVDVSDKSVTQLNILDFNSNNEAAGFGIGMSSALMR
jgi:hypothetical protein